ncbi:MAG: hypothetical protein ABR562_06480 [Thermoplasmatota archaeon]
MFEARVAQFYRAKGYEVHENPKVRGTSENVYAVAMVADGPLGALLISFGDAGGVDGAEIGRVRTMARDVGATPVVAAPTLAPDLRRLAAQMGVVVVDETMVIVTGPLPRDLPAVDAATDPMRRDLDAHPWPASGRAFSFAGPSSAAARDVDELVAELHQPVPGALPTLPFGAPASQLTSKAASAGWQTLVAPETAVAPAPVSAAPATKFSWLGAGLLETQPAKAAGPVDLSALLGAKPAVEHETALTARTPALERAQERAVDWLDAMRDWPWKTILLAGSGAGLLVLVIRWLA